LKVKGQEGERNPEYIPLDEYLRIKGLPFKMTLAMMEEVTFWGQHESSFSSAQTMMRKLADTGITDALIREVCEYGGKKVFEQDRLRAMDVEGNMDQIPDKPRKQGILYIMADGSAINTRKKDENGSSWRENKLGMVFNSNDLFLRRDGVTHDIQRKEYVSCVGPVGEFAKHLFEAAVRNGYGDYEKTIVVSDGAAWIRNMCEELFPDALQILDLYHLAENVFSFGKYLFANDEKQYTPWAEHIISLLKRSEWEEVLTRLEKYKNRVLPAGVVNLNTYIRNNRHKIDYAEYKRHGYYIGSGPIESGNKTVVQKRCKQAGMRWNETNAQYMLTLRAKEESGLWVKAMEDSIFAA
jgi:hypothetical protein